MAVHIAFDLCNLHETEARSLVVMLNAFTDDTLITRTPQGLKVETAPETDHVPLFDHPEVPVKRNAREKDYVTTSTPITPIPTPDPVEMVEEKAPASEPEVPVVPEHGGEIKVTRRGRPKKVTVDPTSAPTSVQAPVPVPESVPAGTAASAPTVAELRDHLKTFTSRHTVQDGIELLKDFGCTRVSEIVNIPQGEQITFVDRCKNA